MIINLTIETVVGGFRIVASRGDDRQVIEPSTLIGEACAATAKQIPTRIKTLFDQHFSQEKAS